MKKIFWVSMRLNPLCPPCPPLLPMYDDFPQKIVKSSNDVFANKLLSRKIRQNTLNNFMKLFSQKNSWNWVILFADKLVSRMIRQNTLTNFIWSFLFTEKFVKLSNVVWIANKLSRKVHQNTLNIFFWSCFHKKKVVKSTNNVIC